MINKNQRHTAEPKKISRRSFLSGIAVGALGVMGLSRLKQNWEFDANRPQLLYEFSVDNFWYTKVDKDLMVINNPLKGKHKADIVIIGGGFTGLSSAYHLIQRFPNKKIVLLEGACCGYGGSGRNGGHHGPNIGGLLAYAEKADPESGRKAFDVTMYGDHFVKTFAAKHGIDCEFHEKGSLETAIDESHMERLAHDQSMLKQLGIETQLLQGEALKKEVNSPRYIGGLKIPYGGRVNPAKLVQGMKKVVENMGVDIREQTLVVKVNPGKILHIETEHGEITAPVLVLGLNAYAHNLGFFQSRMFPVGAYNIATAPLTQDQIDAIGWHNGSAIHDLRLEFDYLLMSADHRIVIGGSEYPYYANDGLSTGNNKAVIQKLENSLFTTFPQLKGIKIEYKWGGTVSYTLDETPSVGVMGDDNNIFYGVGYCGHGVSFAHTAARIMTDLIAGEKNDFTDFFLVNRSLPYLGPRSTRYLGFKAYKWFLER